MRDTSDLKWRDAEEWMFEDTITLHKFLSEIPLQDMKCEGAMKKLKDNFNDYGIHPEDVYVKILHEEGGIVRTLSFGTSKYRNRVTDFCSIGWETK